MSREEAHLELDRLSFFIGRELVVDAIKMEYLINKSYDDLESRNCSSCISGYRQDDKNFYWCKSLVKEHQDKSVNSKDFGCNKWRKN